MWLHLCYRSGSNIVDYYVAGCYYPPKPVYSTNKFIVTLSGQLQYIIANHSRSFIFVIGDLNMLDTVFLCNDFGLEPIVMATTHGNNLPDQIFVNLCDVYHTNVRDSILKLSINLHIFFLLVLNKLIIQAAELRSQFMTLRHIISINCTSFWYI